MRMKKIFFHILYSSLIVTTVVSTASAFFIWGKRDIHYLSLKNVKCSLNPVAQTIQFSFFFMDSFLSIVDYKVKVISNNSNDIYYLTLIGKHFDDVNKAKEARNKEMSIDREDQSRTNVTLPIGKLRVGTDQLFYKNGKEFFPIEVKISAEPS